MNLSIGPDGTIHQDPTENESEICKEPPASACYSTICGGEFSAECFRKLSGAGAERVSARWVVSVVAVVVAGSLLS